MRKNVRRKGFSSLTALAVLAIAFVLVIALIANDILRKDPNSKSATSFPNGVEIIQY